MKTLSRNEKIAVGIGIVVFIFVLFPSVGFLTDNFGSPFNGMENIDSPAFEIGAQEETFNQKELMEELNNIEGLEIEILEEGEGEVATPGSVVAVHYVGTFEDNTVFDTSYLRGQPLQFTIGAGRVIEGWDKGVAGMREGEKRKLIIAPELAYGTDPEAHDLGGRTLYFEVTMIEVIQKGEDTNGASEEVDA